jgi:hypothetical protein
MRVHGTKVVDVPYEWDDIILSLVLVTTDGVWIG